jgi:carboxylesterase
MMASRSRTLAAGRMLGRGPTEFSAPGRAPCVVAFHGFTGTMSDLRSVLEPLAAAGLAVDGALHPGHGTTAQDLAAVGFEDWLTAGRERLRAATAKHGQAILVGFSMGSLVALQLASERPAGLTALVSMASCLRLSAPAALPLAFAHRLGVPLPDRYLVKLRPGELVDKRGMDEIVCYDRQPLRAAMHVYLGGLRTREVVARIECPTLIVHGRRDGVCPCTNARWLADHIGSSDVTVRIFDRSAHVLGCDGERAEVARAVAAFVARFASAPA